MRMTKLTLLIAMLALAAATFGCKGSSQQSNTNQAQVKADNSTVTLDEKEGYKTEVRAFPSGDIAKVTRVTRPNGNRVVLVEYRDNPQPVEVKDPDIIDRAMDATADELKAAAGAAKGAGATVGDKAEDVAGKVGEGAKQAASEAKDVAADAAEATGKAAKKTGKAVKKLGDKIK
ncbi:MAG TPA: hypothetical protein VNN73_10560 [Blastocatellia bacterium]|nr:hypothetical protein [Blastocatellia bacterium]